MSALGGCLPTELLISVFIFIDLVLFLLLLLYCTIVYVFRKLLDNFGLIFGDISYVFFNIRFWISALHLLYIGVAMFTCTSICFTCY